jgi:methylmalonyl-CoA mutase
MSHETGVADVVDPLGGSYYIEALTADLVAKAGVLIGEAERDGGMTKSVAEGKPKMAIEQAAAARQTRVDMGEDVIVGVNRYKLEEEEAIVTREIDNEKVREEQVAQLVKIKHARDSGRVKDGLEALRNCARSKGENLLEVAVRAAKARATLGEISLAMEDVFGRHAATPKVISGIYNQAYAGDPEYEELQKRIGVYKKTHGRSPSIFIAKMGQDGHDRGAKIIATAFADMGFGVHFGALFETAQEVTAHVKEMGVDAGGGSSLAAGHKTLVPELIGLMAAQGQGEVPVVVGGVIPESDYQFLYDAGVAEIFGPGTNVLEAAFAVLNRIEGKATNQ